MISILISSIQIGLLSGMPFQLIVDSVNEGIGSTLKNIALLVGLGSMFGAILEISGGVQQVAIYLIKKFGEKRAAWALGITGLVISIPVFFDAGLIILIPLAFSLARRTKRSTLYYAIPLLAGLAVGHAFIPPTPGPIIVASLLNVDLGWVILIGLVCGIFALIVSGFVWGSFCGKRYNIPIPDYLDNKIDVDESRMPSITLVIFIILIPLVLIILKSISNVISFFTDIKPIINFLGEPFVALLIAVIFAMFFLGFRYGYTREQLEKVMTKSLEPVGLILLVTACGGVLRFILQNSGLGVMISSAVSSNSIPLVIVGFIISALVRISVGSATVAMTMAGGIVASMPVLTAYEPAYLACVAAAIAGGATVCSHFNDSGFWLVKSLMGIDEKTTLKTWTAMETILGTTGFIVALIISIFV